MSLPGRLRSTRGFAVVAIVVVLFVLLVNTAYLRSTADQVRADAARSEAVLAQVRGLGTGNANILATLLDCIEPEGECAKRGTAVQQELRKTIAITTRSIVVYAFICNDRPGGQDLGALRACIDRLTRRANAGG